MSECPYHCSGGFVLMETLGTKVPCPHCNGLERYVMATSPENPDNIYDTLMIPVQYRHLAANSAVEQIALLRGVNSNAGAALELANFMEAVSNNLDIGKVFRLTACLTVEDIPYFDMNVFVYSMQIKALQKGVGTMPYITADTLNLLKRGIDILSRTVQPAEPGDVKTGFNGRTVPLYQRMLRTYSFDYFDYCTSPLVFIDMGGSSNFAALEAMCALLSERSKLGLATYVTNDRGRQLSFLQMHNMLDVGMSRLDRLTPFTYTVKNKDNPMGRIISGIETQVKDSENPYGVKEPGMSVLSQSSSDE